MTLSIDLAQVITSIGVIILGIFGVYQYRINKMTDFNIKILDEKAKNKNNEIIENIGQIYGFMWSILFPCGFDRVYIVRPHPEKSHEFISVQLEVKRSGISSVRNKMKKQPLSEVPHLAGRLSSEDFFVVKDTSDEMELQDTVARSIFACNGTVSAAVVRMEDRYGNWTGNIFATCTRINDNILSIETKRAMENIANRIQLILPAYDED